MHKNCPNEQFLEFLLGVIASLGSYRLRLGSYRFAWKLSLRLGVIASLGSYRLRLEVIALLGSYAALPRS